MKLIDIICLLVTLSLQVHADEWKSFKQEHGKRYASLEDEILRKSIFTKNLKLIREHNAKFEKGLTSYTMKMNEFGDMLPNELERYLGSSSSPMYPIIAPVYNYSKEDELPDFVDWRTKGAVTPVKHQGSCGSCWAFSAAGTLETQLWKKTGKLVALSEQNIIDCAWKFHNCGCGGGFSDRAFLYIQENKGIASESSYPYEENDNGTCRYQSKDSVGYNVGFVKIPEDDEIALQSAVANIGPISVALKFGPIDSFYSKGIIDSPDCTKEPRDHALVVVGYGTENEIDYWLIKNSYGDKWGDDGYFKLARNKNSMCGVAARALYPVV